MLSFQSFVTGFAPADISGEARRRIRRHVAILLKVTWLRKWIVHFLACRTREEEAPSHYGVCAMELYSFSSVLDNKRTVNAPFQFSGKAVLTAADT